MLTFQEAKALQARLYAAAKDASAQLNAVPGVGSGPMGLTPDRVKFSQPYLQAHSAYHRAAADVRAFNAKFTKHFARELREERRNRR